MRCPECASDIDPRLPRCGGCGVDLLEAFERRAFESEVAGAAQRHVREDARGRKRRVRRSKVRAVAAGLAALGFLAFALSRLRPPLPPGARQARGCAFVPPPGMAERPPVSGAWTGLARWEQGPASLDVLYAPAGLADRAASGAGAAAVAGAAFNGVEPRVETSRSMEIDGVEALRLSVSAGRAYLPSPEAGRSRGGSQPAPRYESQPMRGELVLIPASGATLVVRGVASEAGAPALRRSLDAFCARFRVLARPS